MVSSGGLCSQSGLEPLPDLIAILFPLPGVGDPITVDELRGLQAFEGLGQVDTPLGSVGVPSLQDSLAPCSPILTGSIGGGEGRERGTGGGDGLASDLCVVVFLPLVSVLNPSLGC